MQLKEIMHTDVRAIDLEETSVSDAIDKMAREKVDSLVVMNGQQVAGISESLETLPGWRVLLVKKMKHLKVLDHVFSGNAPGREHASHYLESIHCTVSSASKTTM